uniref:Uncharacterized protein n=1 Tax=Rhizophora mucronata TaxID=61149 RepID=A0A2P2QJ93_RHIMU
MTTSLKFQFLPSTPIQLTLGYLENNFQENEKQIQTRRSRVLSMLSNKKMNK